MNKENNAAKFERPLVRVTRARAKALGTSSGTVQPMKPFQDQKRVLRVKSKRSEMEENRASTAAISSFQHKRRAVLRDVTNNALKNQTSEREPPKKIQKLARNVCEKIAPVQEDAKTKLAEELSKIKVAESEEFGMAVELGEDEKLPSIRSDGVLLFAKRECGLQSTGNKEEHTIYEKSSDTEFVNIDSNLKDPRACSLYAPYIYNNRRLTELERRSSSSYMEELQTDISPNMRAILIDWLVEVSEEYNLVPDTLYLTISLIDRYLSRNRIEKQRLQLVGVASMLIASKYEEICAPRAEEFCFITDSTYTRAEVLKMESEILNVLHFHLSVPTTKTFLRRFIKAAQSSNKDPVIELEFLANYLAEITLVDYNFLKFLPSLIAASAVFLARWTLNQSDNPWNHTLEHYTGYKASDLKNAVLSMSDLQVKSNSDPRSAIREKYKQEKFKGVATLTSIQPLGTLFQ